MNRTDDGHPESKALVTCLWWSSATEPGHDCPKYRQSSVCLNTNISALFRCKSKDSFKDFASKAFSSQAPIPYPHPLSQLKLWHFHSSPATQLNSAAKGHGGRALPLSFLLPRQNRHWEAAYPADQWLTFMLNGSMKSSLITKFKSLSAEQFK